MKAIERLAALSLCAGIFVASTLLVAHAAKKAAPPAGPKPGDPYRGPHGEKAEVECVWTADYISEQRNEFRGQRGTFGLLLIPVSKDEKTTASLVIVQAKDVKSGQMLTMINSGYWTYHASNLRYVAPDGSSGKAGADVTGHGTLGPSSPFKSFEISSSGSDDETTIEVSVEIDGSSKQFDVPARWNKLEMKDVMHVRVGHETETGTWRAHLTGGVASGNAGPGQNITLPYSWGSKTSNDYGVYYGQWTFQRNCHNGPEDLPPNDYVPPAVILSRQRYADPTPTPTKRGPAGNAVHTIFHTGTEGILTLGGNSPR
jgi:hypothetical protein